MGAPSLFVIVLVLCAAFLHALWNALIKGSGDQALTLGLVNLGHAVVGAVLVVMFLPPAVASWPFLVASTIIHLFYYGFLLLAYRFGDLSEVYPIARGIAPVLVTLGALVFVGEVPSPAAWMGILFVSGGIALIFFGRTRVKGQGTAIRAALVTGFTIATYSVVDGMGVRASASPFGYIGWLFLLEVFATGFLFYSRRKVLTRMSMKFFATGLAGGVISALAYGLAIYAMSLAAFGAVSAIRESSVIIAALIGVVWFGERPWKLRVVASIVVAFGVIVLATAK